MKLVGRKESENQEMTEKEMMDMQMTPTNGIGDQELRGGNCKVET